MNTTATLTRRQLEITDYLVWGCSDKEVADKLNISKSTVTNTKRSIYERLEISKVTELSVWYFCTKFQISFDFSPLKRAVTSVLLLLVLLPYDFSGGNVLRVARAKTSVSRTTKRNESWS